MKDRPVVYEETISEFSLCVDGTRVPSNYVLRVMSMTENRPQLLAKRNLAPIE